MDGICEKADFPLLPFLGFPHPCGDEWRGFWPRPVRGGLPPGRLRAGPISPPEKGIRKAVPKPGDQPAELHALLCQVLKPRPYGAGQACLSALWPGFGLVLPGLLGSGMFFLIASSWCWALLGLWVAFTL